MSRLQQGLTVLTVRSTGADIRASRRRFNRWLRGPYCRVSLSELVPTKPTYDGLCLDGLGAHRALFRCVDGRRRFCGSEFGQTPTMFMLAGFVARLGDGFLQRFHVTDAGQDDDCQPPKNQSQQNPPYNRPSLRMSKGPRRHHGSNDPKDNHYFHFQCFPFCGATIARRLRAACAAFRVAVEDTFT